MTTLEGNKLIAEFMGWAYSPNVLNDGMPTYTYTDSSGTTYATEYMFKYHSSWDWLMPSWAALRLKVWEFGGYPKEFMVYIENFKAACFNNAIGDAWMALLDGIQWYNSQSKNGQQ